MNSAEKTILTIYGGPRTDGYSAGLLRRFTDELDSDYYVGFRRYNAYKSNFAPCTDCRFCREFEGCSISDMDGFFADFEAADAIVIASPVYNMSFPSPMKAIIDRMQRYYSARFFLNIKPPIVKRRPVALLLSAGSSDESGELIIRQLKQVFSVTNCEIISKMILAGTDSHPFYNPLEKEIRREMAYFAATSGFIAKSSQNT